MGSKIQKRRKETGERKNFIIDLDRCVCQIASLDKVDQKSLIHAKVIPGARDWINQMRSEGNNICFFASRPESMRELTEKWLSSHGFSYDSLILGKPLANSFHYIDDRHVRATTFRGRYTKLVRKEHRIEVFS